jgi:Na+-translocating ferredoxin:NAD+ oxidoreductase RnfG subunit
MRACRDAPRAIIETQGMTMNRCASVLALSAVCALALTAAAAKFPSADETIAAFKKATGAVEEAQKSKAAYYLVKDAAGKITKLAYLKEARGYKGKIDLFVVVNKNGDSIAYESVQIVEGKNTYKEVTKGQEAPFLKQFAGKAADTQTSQIKIDAMTSATMTSREIMRAIDQERDAVLAAFGIAKK